MNKIETKIPGVYILEPQVFGDHRGYFMETYSQKAFAELGIDNVFVQDNQSFTAQAGSLRGIHFQNAPMAQAKLVRVTKGAVLDVAVDLRKDSPTYLQWVGVELSAENKRMLMIPRGFGHGFKTLTDDVVSFVTFQDLPDQDPKHYGLSGSATQVERIFPPEKQTQKQTVTGDAETQAEALFALLGEKKLL